MPVQVGSQQWPLAAASCALYTDPRHDDWQAWSRALTLPWPLDWPTKPEIQQNAYRNTAKTEGGVAGSMFN